MAAAVSSVPRLTFLNNSGVPLNGGNVYTYAAGTLTPKTFYSDESKTVPVSNPIVINAAGRPQASALDSTEVNLYYTGSAKFVVKDSSGSTLYTCDNVEEVAVVNTTALAFPLTVTGVTSGGVIYASSTTVIASSALLASTALMLGGGAGTAPSTDSNWTINSSHYLNSATQPRCSTSNSAAQVIGNSAFTTVTFDTEDYDVGAMHSTSANTSRLTIPASGGGLYTVIAAITFDANATGQRLLQFAKNGTRLTYGGSAQAGSASSVSGLTGSLDLSLAAADYIEVMVFQDSGGNLNIGNGANTRSVFQIKKTW